MSLFQLKQSVFQAFTIILVLNILRDSLSQFVLSLINTQGFFFSWWIDNSIILATDIRIFHRQQYQEGMWVIQQRCQAGFWGPRGNGISLKGQLKTTFKFIRNKLHSLNSTRACCLTPEATRAPVCGLVHSPWVVFLRSRRLPEAMPNTGYIKHRLCASTVGLGQSHGPSTIVLRTAESSGWGAGLDNISFPLSPGTGNWCPLTWGAALGHGAGVSRPGREAHLLSPLPRVLGEGLYGKTNRHDLPCPALGGWEGVWGEGRMRRIKQDGFPSPSLWTEFME